MTNAIEIKWTETKEHVENVVWMHGGVFIYEFVYHHERDLPESWKTEKPGLYTKLRHYIWQHRELEDEEFLDNDGELATIEKTPEGFLFRYCNGVSAFRVVSEIERMAEFRPSPRSWPRALDYARRHSVPELADDEYQFPDCPVRKMRLNGSRLEMNDGERNREFLARMCLSMPSAERPVWQRILDFYDREMMRERVWRNGSLRSVARVFANNGRVFLTSGNTLSLETALEVADHLKALAEVMKAQSEAGR